MYLKYAGIIISTHYNICIVSLSVEKLVQSRKVIMFNIFTFLSNPFSIKLVCSCIQNISDFEQNPN